MLQANRIAVLGLGKLGESLVRGMLAAGSVKAERFVATAASVSPADGDRGASVQVSPR